VSIIIIIIIVVVVVVMIIIIFYFISFSLIIMMVVIINITTGGWKMEIRKNTKAKSQVSPGLDQGCRAAELVPSNQQRRL
jgi:hypothetical protein